MRKAGRELVLGLLPALLAAGCGQRQVVREVPIAQLLRPAPGLSTASLARASIGSENRPVLSRPGPAPVLVAKTVRLPDAPAYTLRAPLPEALRGATLLWVQPLISAGSLPVVARATWKDILHAGRRSFLPPASLARPSRGEKGDELRVKVDLPADLRGREALAYMVARPVIEARSQRHDSGPLAVPREAVLEVGFGIEDAAQGKGWPPVLFRVSCRRGGGAERVLLARELDPAHRAQDRRWQDVRLPLASCAGKGVHLVLESLVRGDGAGVARPYSFPVWSSPAVVAPRPWPARRRNLILISVDTLRARDLGAYGYYRETSPNFDRRIAARGALLLHAVSELPFTPPSHMTMLTGLEPCAHGVRDIRTQLAPSVLTVAEILRAAGYTAAAFTEDAFLVAENGFARGFEVYRENRSPESASPGFAAQTLGEAGDWITSHAGRPFFAFVHTYQVHEPYSPPPAYQRFFATYRTRDGKERPLAGAPEQVRHQADYDREIRYLDDLLGRFLDRLESAGLASSTLLVVTSDHGEGFAEHFWTGHGFDVQQETLRVPLTLRAPGLIPAGLRVAEPVGLVDLVPTLLDLLGVPLPAAVQGRSFARLLTGEGPPFVVRPLVSEALLRVRAVRIGRWKLIVDERNGKRQLFDLEADPHEQHDVASAHPDVVARAEAALAAHDKACKRWQRSGGAGKGPDALQAPWIINRQELEKKLRSLGYVR